MGSFYLDTSALVKLYVQEPGTIWLLALFDSDHRLKVSALAGVEARSAVRRRQQAGDIRRDLAEQILAELSRQIETRFLRQPVTDAVLDLAAEMVDRYALRGFDAVQLASCLIQSPEDLPVFLSADRQLLAAARSEMLRAIDPSEAQAAPA